MNWIVKMWHKFIYEEFPSNGTYKIFGCDVCLTMHYKKVKDKDLYPSTPKGENV